MNGWIIAGVIGLVAVIGFFLLVLLPNRSLDPVPMHGIGDITDGGLVRNVALQI